MTDIGVYISSIINQPSEDNCQQYFLNQSRFKFSCQNPSQYIYFTIKSQYGCQIKISLFFVGHSHSINPKDINEERLKHDITAQLLPNTTLDQTWSQLLCARSMKSKNLMRKSVKTWIFIMRKNSLSKIGSSGRPQIT